MDNIIIRKSIIDDVFDLKDKLRKNDIEEMMSAFGVDPLTGLKTSFENSVMSYTIEKNGENLGIFGIVPSTILGQRGIIWFLATDELDKIKMTFVRKNKQYIEMFLEAYPYIDNYVHVKNTKSIKWLSHLGATVESPKRYGIKDELFHHFYFSRN